MILINHPLLDQLHNFHAEAARRFPADFDHGLGQLGLFFHDELENGGYHNTPVNTVAFASTGGDGVHFSFLVEDDRVTEDSPVVITVPSGGEPEDANFIVGENLPDFLRFGLRHGYFALEQLAYYPELTLEAYRVTDWEPTEDWHYSVGYCLDENGKQVRDYLAEQFDLTPLPFTADAFAAQQSRYKPALVYPDESE